MFKVIAIAVAIAATTSIAGAQASTVAKSTVKTGTVAKPHRTMKKEESQAALQKEAKISEETARATRTQRCDHRASPGVSDRGLSCST